MVNTKNELIADRYAQALVDIAKEGKLTYEKISDNLSLIEDILTQSKDLKEFLVNPLISIEDKKEIIEKVFSKEINVLIINFLKVLVDKNRFGAFEEVVNSYKKALDDINNITRVTVISAVEMTEEAKKKLKIKLEERLKKNVIPDFSINPDIIAGLVIKIGDNVVDMSLKHKLEDLSKNIIR
ncbi:MAG: ATP synthase F1 subunit delta [Candidatus Gastranaerophilales bacterium]|nr:ATP synthase F1 subunit delta [Candidatus Gastranaerophilales bacterium]